MDIDAVCRKLGYKFKQHHLLKQALTHRSYGTPHNERLEFLGDSILNCIIALKLYQSFSNLSEGELSRMRASLVNKQTLFELAQSLNLGDYILLGEGELKSGGFRRPSILADSFEALLGGILLDSDIGFHEVEKVINVLFDELFKKIDPKTLNKDSKTLLQEYLQSKKMGLPQYTVTETYGETHEQAFKVECFVRELNIRCVGEGLSRRSAEQEAAKRAYTVIKDNIQ
jgi:ribonuclease-3